MNEQTENRLPQGWEEVELGEIGDIVTGNTPSRKYTEYYGGDFCWVKPSDIRTSRILFTSEERLTEQGKLCARVIPVNSVMVTCIGNLGNVSMAGKKMCTNQQINSVVFGNKVLSKFGYYYCLTLKPWLIQNSTSTTISMVNKSVFSTAPFRFPPKKEQEKIVTKLDAIFSEIDMLKNRLHTIPEVLAQTRQAILHQAVTGQLTKEWRKGKDLESVENTINRVKNNINDLKTDRKKFFKQQSPIINVQSNLWTETQFYNLCVLKRGFDLPKSKRELTGEYVIASSAGKISNHNEYKVEEGVVVGRSGSVGNTHWIDEKHWPLNTTLYVQDFCDNDKKFVYYYLLNFNFKKYSSSTAVPTLNRNYFVNELIKIPPLEEQQEIVNRVESLFSKLDIIEKQYQNLATHIQNLPQAVLHKAFKGELF